MKKEWEFKNLQLLPAVVTVDRHCKFKKVDDNFKKLFGYIEQEESSMSLEGMNSRNYLPISLEIMHKMVAGEVKNYRLKKKYSLRNGHLIETCCSVNGRYNNEGNFIEAIIEITDQETGGMACTEIEEMVMIYRPLLNGASLGAILYDLTTQKIIYTNTAAQEIFDKTEEELLQDITTATFDSGSIGQVIADFKQKILSDDNVTTIQWIQKGEEGTDAILEIQSYSLKPIKNNIYVLLIKNITEQNKAQETQKELERLQKELDISAREISSNLMYLSDKNNTLSNVKEGLVELSKKAPGNLRRDIHSLINQISRDENLDEDWDKFKLHFERVHPDFFSNLKAKFPVLSQRELKHCAYIQIGLNVKEVAQVLAISTKGVEMARYRIKKKLKVEEKQKLSDFIQSLTK